MSIAAGLCALLLLAAAPLKKAGVFEDVTRSSGVKMDVRSDLPRLKLIATMIGGCAVGDFDGDGRPDLYVANSVPRWGKPNTASAAGSTATSAADVSKTSRRRPESAPAASAWARTGPTWTATENSTST